MGRLRLPENLPDQPVGAMPTAGDSPASTMAANRRVGMIRWLVSSAKETVTPEGAFGSAELEPKFNPMASRIAESM